MILYSLCAGLEQEIDPYGPFFFFYIRGLVAFILCNLF